MAKSQKFNKVVIPAIGASDESRKASWLQSEYSSHVWTVCDKHDHTAISKIDFRKMLADGRMLHTVPALYASVKEFAWWVRDKRFSKIESATTHVTLVGKLMTISHALSLRGIFSFLDVDPFTIDELVEETAYGFEGLLHASERVEHWIAETRRTRGEDAFRQMSDAATSRLNALAVFAECNLPASVRHVPRVSQLLINLAFDVGILPHKSDVVAAELPEPKVITTTSLAQYLSIFEIMYAMRRRMAAETITFSPFPDSNAAEKARVRGASSSRTKTPPPHMALKLMEFAARYIQDYSDLARIKDATPSETRQLLMACWIAVATFTARRSKEISSLDDDYEDGETPSGGCLRGNDETGWYLHIHIVKTLKEKSWIPVPVMVVRAIEILRVISADARKVSGDKYLFMRSTIEGRAQRFRPSKALDKFADIAGARDEGLTISTAPWHWAPHQFRRFFCVLYFYRWEGASIEVLSHFLRHFDIEMTRRYVESDPKLASIFTDVQWGFRRNLANTITSGEREVSGAAGDRLKMQEARVRERLNDKLSIVAPERVGAWIDLFMQQEAMVVTPKSWVTCTCPRTAQAASIAACRVRGNSVVGAEGPDFAHAEPAVCGGCPHAMHERGKGQVLSDEIEHLKAAKQRSGCLQTIFGELVAARLVKLEAVHESSYLTASALTGRKGLP